MTKRLSTQPKLTTEQVKALAEIARLAQDFYNLAGPAQLGPKFGTSKQLIQYHINKAKAEEGGEE